MRREDEFDQVFMLQPADRTPGPSGNKRLSIHSPDDVRLPLVIGIAADRELTAKAAQKAEEPVAKILADMRGIYPATPFLLLVQLPATLRSFVDRLAETFAADLVDVDDHLAPAPGSPGETQATKLRGDPRRTRRQGGIPCGPLPPCDRHLGPTEPAADGLVGLIIQFRREGIPDRHTGRPLQLEKVGLGSVQHIVAGNPDGAAADCPTSTLLCPPVEALSGDEEADDATAWDHLDRFNADAAAQGRRRPSAPPARRPRPRGWPAAFAWLDGRFAVADVLAIRFQRATHQTLCGLLALGLVAAVAWQLSGILPYATGFYAAALAPAYGWYLWAYWRRYEHRFHDYRALAEGLRVQMYWSAAGITSCAADHYLRRQRNEFEWIRQALRTWTLIAGMDGGGTPLSQVARRHGLQQVCEQWVDDQWNYYRRTALHHQSLGKWLNRGGKVFFVLGLLLVGAKSLFHDNPALGVAMGLAPAVAALLYMYAQTRAFVEQAQQYDRMGRLFGEAKHRLRRVLEEGDVGAFQRLLVDLGKEALRENGDWLLLHRERPITFGSARTWAVAGSWVLKVCARRGRAGEPGLSAASVLCIRVGSRAA